MATTRKQHQKSSQRKQSSRSEKFGSAEPETAALQSERLAQQSKRRSANRARAIRQKELEDYRHSGIPVGSDPRE